MSNVINITPFQLPDVKLIEVQGFCDERGGNVKLFSSGELKAVDIDFTPLEILVIHSNRNVLRGLHYQKEYGQSRIVACLSGEMFVAAVDVNSGKNSCGQSITHVLRQPYQCIYIPAGYALGTYALTDTDFLCICGEHPYYKEYASGIRWDDPELGIGWPVEGKTVILSETDKKLPYYKTTVKNNGEI